MLGLGALLGVGQVAALFSDVFATCGMRIVLSGTDSPVFLTRNGRVAYAILTMEDHDRVTAEQALVSALAKGTSSAQTS